MRPYEVHTAGLSGDLGWNESEDMPLHGLATGLLVVASGAVWTAVWISRGLAPLLAAGRHAPDRLGEAPHRVRGVRNAQEP